MADEHRERLRTTSGAVAERYDAVRPGYPRAVLDDLLRLAGVGPDDRVLEIGCGTGQLTVPLAARGLRVTAIEPGPDLARVARRNLAAHPMAEVVVGAFEEVALEPGSFDLVVATSVHRLDPAVRVERSVDLLRAGGALAVIDTEHVAGGSAAFFADAQACHRRWDPTTPPGPRLPTAAEVPTARPELDDSPRLGPVHLRRRQWDAEYTTERYLALLLTCSGHLALPAADRRGLRGCLGALIAGRYGGRITQRYLTDLRVAHRAG
ncbi:class I SAM-dependent methyltransferase [Pseudonocardia humida]|uniref:Class I SAM-dependent methyltransferase n=1 Tax=Pseudonocardia humida TaxID=2800819 RepID=A0ABT1A4V4_9PSEU|nr:class I SAM-dependent methyltransferase [Pseudonocardia humida]MCO1658027.1 class I SAM-dependent methyltransferase [Pseudonocardia humida]